MSEANGAIPGTSIGQPGHPQGTHTNGYDIDLGYYQRNTNDNRLRPICAHTAGGQEANHCTGEPTLLDPWRHAAFLGFVLEHSGIRVIGVDGRAGPLLREAMTQLCAGGWLTTSACSRRNRVVFETTDQGLGWFYFHHHHSHISRAQVSAREMRAFEALFGERPLCLVPDCSDLALTEQRLLEGLPPAPRLDAGRLGRKQSRSVWRRPKTKLD
jgi:hypothetical protein